MRYLIAILFIFVIFFSFTTPVFAQESLVESGCIYTEAGQSVLTLDCIPVLFTRIIYWLLVLSGTVALFFIIFGGIKLLMSSGEQAKVESAKKTITWAIIGLIIVLFSFAIVRIIADMTGVGCITKFGFKGTCI